jgi:hypothetical protein
MVASNATIQPPLNYLTNEILICYCGSQILELCYIFEPSVSSFYIMILVCTLVTRHLHILSFLYVYFYSNLLTSTN